MAHHRLIFALFMAACASPVPASSTATPSEGLAPAGGPDTQYCLRVEPVTGTRLEFVMCMTRQQWSEQGVDVDREWAEEGVSVKG